MQVVCIALFFTIQVKEDLLLTPLEYCLNHVLSDLEGDVAHEVASELAGECCVVLEQLDRVVEEVNDDLVLVALDLLLLRLDQAIKFVFHLRILFNHLVLALDLASGAKCCLCLASWRSCGLYWIQRVQDTLLVDLLDQVSLRFKLYEANEILDKYVQLALVLQVAVHELGTDIKHVGED